MVGVGVGAAAVRAVVLARGRVAWSGESAVGPECTLDEALARLLDAIPRPAFGMPRLVAAVGPAQAQVRRLEGLPDVRRERTVSALVRENANRFFLVNGDRVVTTAAQRTTQGAAWAGAIDQPVVDALVRACNTGRLRLSAICPAAAVLGYALRACHERDAITWRDGDLVLVARYRDQRLDDCRRCFGDTAIAAECRVALPHPALAALGEEGSRFADAVGAALAGRSPPLALRPGRELDGAPPPRLRLAAAGLLCAASLSFAGVAPGIAGAEAARRADEHIASIARAGASAERDQQELIATLRRLRDLHTFARGARSPTLLLGSLTEAIDDETMLLSLRADSAGGTLVAVTPRAAALVSMLDSVPQIAGAAISGPVAPEARRGQFGLPGGFPAPLPEPAGTDEEWPARERVTVRFSWRSTADERGR